MSSGSERVEPVEVEEYEEETSRMTEHLYRRRVRQLRAQHGEHSAYSGEGLPEMPEVVDRELKLERVHREVEYHTCSPYTNLTQRECALLLGQRVTWFTEGSGFFEVVAEHGVVRWLGRLRECPQNLPDMILAGIQFVLLFASLTLFFGS